eukprot:PITA_19752
MLAARIIEPVEESDWVSPMVVQEKKQKDEIRICIDIRKMNDAFVHDPFPTLFTNEVLDNVGGYEEYSFTYGFSGYHHIKIMPKDMRQLNVGPDHLSHIETGTAPGEYTSQQKKELVVWTGYFSVIVGHLYKMGSNEILQRYVPNFECIRILIEAHGGVEGGHYARKATT